jgi:hypothetical protein
MSKRQRRLFASMMALVASLLALSSSSVAATTSCPPSPTCARDCGEYCESAYGDDCITQCDPGACTGSAVWIWCGGL